MPSSSPERRHCPTRIDGADSLIEHLIDPATCQGRQRRHYHKCHACAHHVGAGDPQDRRAGRVLDVLVPHRRAEMPTPAPVRRHVI